MRELVITAAIRGPGQNTIASFIEAGQALTPYLIADMPHRASGDAREVAAGTFRGSRAGAARVRRATAPVDAAASHRHRAMEVGHLSS